MKPDSLPNAAQAAVNVSNQEMAKIITCVGRLTDLLRNTTVANVRISDQGT